MNFSVINEVDRCKTASGHYTIGIFDIEIENYEILQNIMEIMRDIEKVTNIVIDKTNYSIKYINCGDMKFLLNIYGNLYENKKNEKLKTKKFKKNCNF